MRVVTWRAVLFTARHVSTRHQGGTARQRTPVRKGRWVGKRHRRCAQSVLAVPQSRATLMIQQVHAALLASSHLALPWGRPYVRLLTHRVETFKFQLIRLSARHVAPKFGKIKFG